MSSSVVSICVPLYNGEKYLRESLDSIVNQTYKKLDIVIVDDLSSDNGVAIAEDYAKIDTRIRIIRNEQNLGLVGNWNKCIQETKGEYFKLHFQDDIMVEETIQKMLDFALSHAVDIVVSDRNYIFENDPSEESRTKFYREELPKLSHFVKKGSVIEPVFLADLVDRLGIRWNFIGEPILGLMKLSIVNELGFYDQTFNQIGDFEFWLRIGLNRPFGFLPEELHTFRHHGNSQTSKNASNKEINPSHLDRIHLAAKMNKHQAFQNLRNINPSFSRKAVRGYWKEYSNRYGKEKLKSFISQEYREVIEKTEESLWKKLSRKFV